MRIGMRIGIVGSGMIGGTLGVAWARAGHAIDWSSRHPETLADLVERGGPKTRATSVDDALASAEVVLLAVPFGAVRELGARHRDAFGGKVVLDATNPFERRDGEDAREALASPGGSGTFTARTLPGARVVKAFNTVYFQTMQAPRRADGSLVAVPLAGDDAEALAIAERLVRDAGMDPVVVGPLARSASFDPGSRVWNSGASAAELARALAG